MFLDNNNNQHIRLQEHLYDVLNELFIIIIFIIQEHLYDVLDLPNANEVPNEERRTLRISAESKKFGYEHYLMDKYMPQNDQELLAFQPPYLKDGE